MDEATYRSLPNTYHWSDLKVLWSESPRAFRWHTTHPREDSPAFTIGRAAHVAILEPHRLPLTVAVAPECDRRTKAGKETWEQFMALNAGRDVLKREDYDRIVAMSESVRSHPDAMALLRDGQAEQVIGPWTDERTGLRLVGRADWRTRFALVDLKTDGKGLEPRAWAARAWRYGYYHQLALYRAGIAAVEGVAPMQTVVIAVESKPPFDVGVFDLDEEGLEVAAGEVREVLDTLSQCLASDKWPGRYPERTTLRPPEYALMDEDGDEDWNVNATEEVG